MLPSARLLELAREPFSHDWLDQVQATLEQLPPLDDSARVAVFVLRRVCTDLARFLDTVQPVEAARHDAIEAALRDPLGQCIECLARFHSPSTAQLAALIAASEQIRRHL